MKSGMVSGSGGSFSSMALETAFLHLLSGGVVGLHTHAGELQRVGTVDIGMGDVDAVVEDCRFTEDHILYTDLIGLLGILAALEPDQIHDARAVREMGDHTLLTRPHLEGLEAEDMSYDLNEGHVARQFVDGVDLGTVDILIGIITQQVAIGTDTELIAQNLLPVRSHSWQVLYVLV